jgi:hypothetical protein
VHGERGVVAGSSLRRYYSQSPRKSTIVVVGFVEKLREGGGIADGEAQGL